MPSAVQEVLEWIRIQHQSESQLVLLFDYDGTLAEFADDPSRALLPNATRKALEALASQPRVTVGVLSGRELEELKRMVNVPGLFYAGTDGLELEFQGRLVAHPLVWHSAEFVSQVADALEPHVEAFPSAWLERKRFGLTVHYRQLDPEQVPELLETVERQLAQWRDRLHIVTGAKAVEITPEIGWTKGTAVEFVMKNLGSDPLLVLYAGDEACDVEALWTAGIRGGIAIGVGPAPPTTAQYKLPDVVAVQQLLDEICHTLGCNLDSARSGNCDRNRAYNASGSCGSLPNSCTGVSET